MEPVRRRQTLQRWSLLDGQTWISLCASTTARHPSSDEVIRHAVAARGNTCSSGQRGVGGKNSSLLLPDTAEQQCSQPWRGRKTRERLKAVPRWRRRRSLARARRLPASGVAPRRRPGYTVNSAVIWWPLLSQEQRDVNWVADLPWPARNGVDRLAPDECLVSRPNSLLAVIRGK